MQFNLLDLLIYAFKSAPYPPTHSSKAMPRLKTRMPEKEQTSVAII